MVDISLFNTVDTSEAGMWMSVLDFDWVTPIGCDILVLGPDSKEAVQIADEEEKLNQQRLTASFVKGKKEPDATTGDEEVAAAIRKAVRLTKNWREMSNAGQEFSFSTENAIKLYTNSPHIRNQVLRNFRDRANFTSPEYANWRKRFGEGSSLTIPEKGE